MINALTIDVEDYFMVSAFADRVRFDQWDGFEGRVERNTMKVLDLLDEHGVKATFFVLGWVAGKYPAIVREIWKRGHEIASHSYRHRLAYELTKEEFREDTRLSKRLIEDITGERVIGYRAPSYSITERSMWGLDVLIEEGFVYDSSIFPIRHDRYGIPGFSRFARRVERGASGEILEMPLSTVKVLGKNVPIAGGGYLRLFPMSFIEWGISSLNSRESQPAIIYFHPWEIDPEQPRLNGSALSVFRHHVNIDKTLPRLRRLLKKYRFAPLRQVFSDRIKASA